ncbi:MAG: sigma-70 family RNA polymerase sigma factor [Planctomycetota bacterium]
MTELSASEVGDYAVFLQRVASGILRPGDVEPEDLAQDALLVGLQASPRDTQRLKSWYRTIVRRRALELQRKTARRLAHEKNAPVPSEASSPVQIAEHRAAIKDLTSALAQLSLQDYELVRLRYFDGLTVTQVAKSLGLARSTVMQREQKALETLRRSMQAKPRGSKSLSLLAVSASSVFDSAKAVTSKLPALGVFGTVIAMNKLVLLSALLLCTAAVFFWLQSQPADNDLRPTTLEQASVSSSPRTNRRAQTSPETETKDSETLKASTPADRDRDLFGRVTDEAGHPLQDVLLQSALKDYDGLNLPAPTIEASYDYFTLPGVVPQSAHSNADGRFSMRHEPGDLLQFLATKPGYASRKTQACLAGEKLEIVMKGCGSSATTLISLLNIDLGLFRARKLGPSLLPMQCKTQ